MGKKTLSVSIEADRAYIRALGILAENKEITIGKLTKIAIDALYGAEIEPLVAFFAESGLQKDQSPSSNTSSSTKEE